MADKA